MRAADFAVMVGPDLRVSNDVSPGAWIGSRLQGGVGAVTRTVPGGFASYARICHPAPDGAGRLATWPEVARQTGRRVHPLMQWHALVGSADWLDMAGSSWPGAAPQRGNLLSAVLARLCDVLGDHTATAERCFFCLWEGYGWVANSCAGLPSARAHSPGAATVSSAGPVAPAFSREELSRPRLRLAGRDYLLLAGPLEAALQIGWWLGPPEAFVAQSPNLFWPADRAWCVASEIDFDSTLVGGSTELVDAILRSPELDSWPVQADDSLAYDADRINPVA